MLNVIKGDLSELGIFAERHHLGHFLNFLSLSVIQTDAGKIKKRGPDQYGTRCKHKIPFH
jgi:hypothetical protein